MKTKVKEVKAVDTYYRDQLDKLVLDEFGMSVKIQGGGESTKWLSLNEESIDCLVSYLLELKDKLK